MRAVQYRTVISVSNPPALQDHAIPTIWLLEVLHDTRAILDGRREEGGGSVLSASHAILEYNDSNQKAKSIPLLGAHHADVHSPRTSGGTRCVSGTLDVVHYTQCTMKDVDGSVPSPHTYHTIPIYLPAYQPTYQIIHAYVHVYPEGQDGKAQ